MIIGGAYCDNCENLLAACDNTFLPMDHIHNIIRRRNFPFCQDLYSLMGMTRLDGMQNFADIVLEAKNEFEEYNGLVIKMTFDMDAGEPYMFKGNFFDWIDKKIPASDVEFFPTSIIHMTNVVRNLPQVRASSQWTYDKVTGRFSSLWSTYCLHYFTQYPYRHEISEATTSQLPVWTSTSGVYLISDPDYFIDQVSYAVLMRIQMYSKMVPLEGFSGQLQLDDIVNRLKERVEENRSKTSSIYTKWRTKA
ncbi:MAG: hypothetical protein MJZ34_02865 [Paludibacteraceae bacterium]|nr:hypothetical protein [Paludibacteraceae bacterium]